VKRGVSTILPCGVHGKEKQREEEIRRMAKRGLGELKIAQKHKRKKHRKMGRAGVKEMENEGAEASERQ
jgi:hypothetical protein